MTSARELAHGARSILCAATELFALEGFEAVSMGAIAERAGVSKANVFHHFTSKEMLILAVMREVSQPHARFAESLLHEPGSCVEKLRRLIAFELIDLFENKQKMRLVLREITDHAHDNVRELAQQVFQRNFRAIFALFEQGQQRGELRQDFDPAVATLMLGGANQLFFQSQETLQSLPETKRIKSAEMYAEQIFNILLGGIVANPPASKVAARRKHKVSS